MAERHIRALHTAAMNVACLDDSTELAAQAMLSPLLEQLTALASGLLAAAPEGHFLSLKMLQVRRPVALSVMILHHAS